MAEIICAEDYSLLTEQLRDTDASTEARSVEALQEAWYPTLAQAEKAIGFEIHLPEMDDRFVPEYFTGADYVSVYDSEGNIREEQSVYWVTARFTQYIHYKDEKYFLRTPEKEVTFLKSTELDAESCYFFSASGKYIYMCDEPEQRAAVLQGIPVILGIEDGKIVQARW